MRQNKYKICLIVEGNEEECFFEIVNELGLNERFELIIKTLTATAMLHLIIKVTFHAKTSTVF